MTAAWGTEMRRIFAAVRFNFLGFFRDSRTVAAFLITMVMCYLLSGQVMQVVEYYHTTTQAAEPFIWTFGDATAILLVSLLLIFLLSDLPKLSPFTPFYLARMTKRKWLLAQFLYIVLVTMLYVGFVMLITMLLCMKHSFLGNLWSETAARLGYSANGKLLHVPSTVRVMESIRPYGCMLQTVLLMLGYSLTLGFLILLGNLAAGKTWGMVLALLYSLYGFLLDPEVLRKLLGLEEYEMYRARSIAGWISPLNNAVYGMHDFGYDNLPSIAQSMGIFGGLLLFLAFLAGRALRRYNFTFPGS